MVLFRTRLLLILFCLIKTAMASEQVVWASSAVSPGGETNLVDPFLSQCGHAPIRFFADKLFVIPEFDQSMDRTVVPKLPIKLNKETSLDWQLFDGLEQFVRLRSQGPERRVLFHAGQSYPILIEGLEQPLQDYLVREDEQRSERAQIVAWIHNEDVTLASLARSLPEGLRLDTSELECPLMDTSQGNVCESMAFPYDPSQLNSKLMRQKGSHAGRPEKDLQYETGGALLRRISRRHDARGFAYAVQYEDKNGWLHPAKLETRYTSNPYFIFELLTRTPCAGWKIKRIALNAHQDKTGSMYAYRFDEKQNLLLKTKVMRPTSFKRRENDIYLSYADGATLEFLACSTLQGPGHGIGDFFAGLDPARNPLHEVRGFPHKCVPMLPSATSPALGKRRRWKNPSVL